MLFKPGIFKSPVPCTCFPKECSIPIYRSRADEDAKSPQGEIFRPRFIFREISVGGGRSQRQPAANGRRSFRVAEKARERVGLAARRFPGLTGLLSRRQLFFARAAATDRPTKRGTPSQNISPPNDGPRPLQRFLERGVGELRGSSRPTMVDVIFALVPLLALLLSPAAVSWLLASFCGLSPEQAVAGLWPSSVQCLSAARRRRSSTETTFNRGLIE